ncbi:MAG: hypothetical protein GVY35_16690 [Bacteroidetes bacterium]|nr:hypothetical protein [Bacteroidota bacterium]
MISLPDIRETSPSIAADGRTMVFARTENWRDKVPYIATRSGDGWGVAKAPFADTLYNVALAPDGQSAFFKTYEQQDGEEVSRAYRVERTADGWGAPQDLPSLFNINAGYFCPMAGERHALLLRPHAAARHLRRRARWRGRLRRAPVAERCGESGGDHLVRRAHAPGRGPAHHHARRHPGRPGGCTRPARVLSLPTHR